jgi:probable rRNA maturation factor
LKLVFNYTDIGGGFKIPARFRGIVSEIEKIENKKLGEICYIFVDETKILEINRNFLKHDYVTDVITFEQNVKQLVSGDIYICLDKVAKNAIGYDVPKSQEIFRVMIHGILHLVGYKDKTFEERCAMRKREDYYLNKGKEMGVLDDG